MRRGRLIVLEGLDGVGKTTASMGLAHLLDAHWLTTPRVELRGAPGVRGAYQTADGRALFYASTVVDVGPEITAHLERGRDVVCDRYWLSTLSGAAANGARVSLCAQERLVVSADVTVLLTVDEPTRAARVKGRADVSIDDLSSLEPTWSMTALHALRAGLRLPVSGHGLEFDVSRLDRATTVQRLLAALRDAAM